MNKRQAKIYALKFAAEVLRSSCDTFETEEATNDEEHEKITAELERIATSLESRATRLKENTRHG